MIASTFDWRCKYAYKSIFFIYAGVFVLSIPLPLVRVRRTRQNLVCVMRMTTWFT